MPNVNKPAHLTAYAQSFIEAHKRAKSLDELAALTGLSPRSAGAFASMLRTKKGVPLERYKQGRKRQARPA